MNKTAIKNFAIWARNKLIADISYKAGLLGVTENGIKSPLSQSTQTVQFFDIGTKEPSSITGIEIQQRKKLVEEIERKAKQSDYTTAYKNVIEEVAYTWFNRLIAIRFMEVNDYLPTRIRVLSSESKGKTEPDLVTHALEASLDYSAYEKDRIIQLKHENKLDELFRMLFIKQCNALNANLPELFEKTSDYTELLLNVSFTDKDGVVYHLVNDISEDDFNIAKEGQVEIIGWLYQFYITDLNEIVYDGSFSKERIPKELLSAATTIYTPDWVIRYMVDNSLGKMFVGKHPQLKSYLKFYLDGEPSTWNISVEDVKLLDPCMGSGHILVYAFDVFIQIYRAEGYSDRDAVKLILENNICGLDIDKRAYQLAYFAVMMKARQYNRRILNKETVCRVYSIKESNEISVDQLKCFGADLTDIEKHSAFLQIQRLLDTFVDAKEYGSILNVENYDWMLLRKFLRTTDTNGQMSIDTLNIEDTGMKLEQLIDIAEAMACKYDVVVTNPPYLGSGRFSPKLLSYVNSNYPEVRSDLAMVMYKHALQDLSSRNGYVAFITTSSWMFLSSLEKLRTFVLNNFNFDSLVDFGSELFDGKVGHNLIVAWVNQNSRTHKKMTAIRLVDYCYGRRDEKESEFFNIKNHYTPISDNFTKIPGSPVAYWVGPSFFNSFQNSNPLSKYALSIVKGIFTGDNSRFLRFWFEVSRDKVGSNKKWNLYSKGGEFRKWYGNIEHVINWENDALELRNFSGSGLGASKYFGREHFVWSKITSYKSAFRRNDRNIFFDDASPALVFSNEPDLRLLGLLNSKVAELIIRVIAPTINVQVGEVRSIPITEDISNNSLPLVEQNLLLSRLDWDANETSIDFTSHPLLNGEHTIATAFEKWERITTDRFDALKANEEELNRIFINIYGFQDEIDAIVDDKDVTVRRIYNVKEDIPESMKGNSYVQTKLDVIKTFISYAVGCMFGRYSLDVEGLAYAGGDWDSSNYKSFIPDKDNILPICDDEYFDDDIVGRFVAFVRIVFGASTLEENLNFIASAIGGKGTPREVIRDYFISGFYKDHCKIYQKRPIYWLFDSGKQNGFKALIYMHRYDENTIGNLRIDYLHRMQRIYENEIARMQDTIENSRDAREVTAATKRKEKLIKQLQETKEYDEKIAHLALARTPIDLDDGVKVNYEKVQTDRDGKKLDVLAKI